MKYRLIEQPAFGSPFEGISFINILAVAMMVLVEAIL